MKILRKNEKEDKEKTRRKEKKNIKNRFRANNYFYILLQSHIRNEACDSGRIWGIRLMLMFDVDVSFDKERSM